MSFHSENNRNTDLKCRPPRLGDEEIFHSRSPKMALNGISFTFLSYRKISDLYLIPEGVYKKRMILKNCVKSHLKIFLTMWNSTEKDHICSYKNSTIQAFTSSKIVYFKKHLLYQV